MKKSFLCVLAAMMLLLTGCYSTVVTEQTDSTVTEDSEDMTTEPYRESVTTYPAPNLYSTYAMPGGSPIPAENGGFYFIPYDSKLVNYVSENGEVSVLCGIGGCSHNDASCPAFYPELSGFVSRNGMWYVFCGDPIEQGGIVELLAVNPSDGKRTTLCRWEAEESCTLSLGDLICTDETAFVVLIHYSISEDVTTYTVESISLKSGEKQTMRTTDDGSVNIVGAVSAGLILQTIKLTEPAMDIETYLALHPNASEEEYTEYWIKTEEQNTRYSLEIVAADGTLVDALADTENGYVALPDLSICWNEYVAYQRNGIVYCYDSTTREARALDVEKNPVNIRFFDGRLCLIYPEDGDMYRFVFYDIHTGETIEFEKADVLFFSPHCETDDAFIGNLSGGRGTYIIPKQSFYNEDTDAATLLISR